MNSLKYEGRRPSWHWKIARFFDHFGVSGGLCQASRIAMESAVAGLNVLNPLS